MSRLGNILNAIIEKGVPKNITFSGTTGSTGNLELTNVPSSAESVLPVSVTNPYYAIPFKSGSSWYLKVLVWNVNTYTVASSKAVTATVKYWGGVLRSLIFPCNHFRQEVVA